jgi:hypothetical protein
MLAKAFQTLKQIPGHISRGKNTRNEQERIDTRNLHHVLGFWKRYVELKHREPKTVLSELTQAQIDDLLDTKTMEKSYFDLRDENVEVMEYQLSEMFEKVAQMGGKNPYPKPVYRNGETRAKVTETEKYLSERVPVSEVELFSPSECLEHPGGFEIQIRKSIIDHPESGYGVFVASGEILPGTIVALYPGEVHWTFDTLKPEILKDNEYMISRYDDTVIDGRHWDRKQEVATREAIQLEESFPMMKSKGLHRFRNPYAIGQYVNHPAPGSKPNLMSYSYDFTTSFPDHLRPFIPYQYASPPSSLFFNRPSTIMHSVLLIATRRIKTHEELLLNYRYNPANPYPDWYTQPDPEEALRRWGQVKVL